MNILLDGLPVEIAGIPIYTDFRNMIQFELLVADPDVPDRMRVPFALNLLYKQPIRDLQKAVDGLLWFHRCGEEPAVSGTPGRTGKSERAYDFDVDAADIYAAFMQTYGIDLNDADLHWWKFHALFMGLPENCKIVKIMGYRTNDLSKLKGDEKRHYQKLKDMYRLRPLHIERLPLAAQEQAVKDQVAARFAAAEKWAANAKAI